MLFVYGINVFIKASGILILSLATGGALCRRKSGFGFCSLHASALERTSPQSLPPEDYGCRLRTERTEVGTLSTLINTLWYAYHGEDQANFYLVRA